MGVGLATILFLVLAVGWTVLPFVPAVREIRRKRDIDPLPVARRSRVDVRHFAAGFRSHLDAECAELVAQCRTTGEVVTGTLPDGGEVLVVPAGSPEPPLDNEERGEWQRMVLGTGNLRLPDRQVHLAEICAEGDVQGGARSIYRAILTDGALTLAADSAVLRWLHAGTDLTVGSGCLLHGRVSAEKTLRLDPGCQFERLHAATVLFSTADEKAPAAVPFAVPDGAERLAADDVPDLADERGGRWLVKGDFTLAAGAFLDNDIVVWGDVTIGEGSCVRGSLKCRGTLILEADVQVSGSLVAAKDLEIGPGCRIGGPVICEKELTLFHDSVIGAPDNPTTVSTHRMLAAPGACCHGTVWAHDRGDVLVPTAATPVRGGAA